MKRTIPTSASLKTFTYSISHTLTLVIGGLRALVTLVAFVAILWALSGTLTRSA